MHASHHALHFIFHMSAAASFTLHGSIDSAGWNISSLRLPIPTASDFTKAGQQQNTFNKTLLTKAAAF